MERPRLRPLEAFPVIAQGRRVLALRDPAGLTDSLALLPPAATAIVQLFDGVRDHREIQAEILRTHGELLPLEAIAELVDQLDQALLLDSDRFRQHHAGLRAAFDASPVRAAAHAGQSYPAGPAELEQFLTPFFVTDGAPSAARTNGTETPPRGLIAPHIDFHRGARAYGRTYRALSASDADLFIVFGTDHNGLEHPFTLTRKHYETPLGQVTTDRDLVDALESRLPDDSSLFADELHHRNEHSIEFQALMLRHVLGRERPINVLPVLCGSLGVQLATGVEPEADARVPAFIEALARLIEGRRVCVIAGADLAHVGPRFGDPQPLVTADAERVARADAGSLDACARGSATDFFQTIAAEQDARRVCGTAPIYHTLRLLGSAAGEIVAYEQCPADEEGASFVSIGGVVLR